MKHCIFLLVLFVVVQCKHDPQNNPDLKKANEIHLVALQVNESAIALLESIKEIHISEGPVLAALEENDPKRTAYDAFKTQTIKLAIQHRDWNRDLPEVPGFGDSHDHGGEGDHTHGDEGHSHDDGHGHHDHSHGHSHGEVSEQMENLSPAEILGLQQEFSEKMTTIKSELEKAITNFRNVVK
jgi:hypothetical protein